MNIQEILGINPVLLTSIATSFVAVCGALGIKELLSKIYDRYCSKQDEEDSDHKHLVQLELDVSRILEKLEEMEKHDKESRDNDMLLLEHDILFLQRKAIQFDKVSKSCMPRYMKLYNRYRELNLNSDYALEEEIEVNHKIIEKLLLDGKVCAEFWELYK